MEYSTSWRMQHHLLYLTSILLITNFSKTGWISPPAYAYAGYWPPFSWVGLESCILLPSPASVCRNGSEKCFVPPIRWKERAAAFSPALTCNVFLQRADCGNAKPFPILFPWGALAARNQGMLFRRIEPAVSFRQPYGTSNLNPAHAAALRYLLLGTVADQTRGWYSQAIGTAFSAQNVSAVSPCLLKNKNRW